MCSLHSRTLGRSLAGLAVLGTFLLPPALLARDGAAASEETELRSADAAAASTETAAPADADRGNIWRRAARAVPPDAVLEARGAVFGDVEIVAGDIFDPSLPGESHKLYRLSNKVHFKTRSPVIRRQLLFAQGDRFSRRLIEESERLLRQNKYLYDAEIELVGYHGNRVDVVVWTRDVWTLKPGLSVGRSGGVNSTVFKLQDANFLGLGKGLTFKQGSDVDRDTVTLRYEDPNLAGSRVRLWLEYADHSDGELREIKAAQPFYSLDSRWSAGLRLRDESRIQSLYAFGEGVEEFHHRGEVVDVYGGLSRGLRDDGRAWRWLGGVTFEEHTFRSLEDVFGPDPEGDDPLSPHRPTPIPPKDIDPTEPEPTPVPEHRTLVYPWIGFESLGDNFAEAHDLDQMGRTEDLELGNRYSFRLGWASDAWGSDADAAVVAGSWQHGWLSKEGHTFLAGLRASGRYERESESKEAGARDVHLSARARYYWRNFGEHLFFVNVEGDMVYEPDPEQQLLLGGDSGLRGYPLRYLDGEKRLLVSLEQRFFTNWYPFRLAYVGAAVFVDVGRTWGEGLTTAEHPGWLADAGFGLRISNSRSGLGSVLHLDVAFPLNGDPSIQDVQWLVSTKASF